MENISFTKMSGAGNDFIILKDFPEISLTPVFIQKLCNRRYGIGSDGVINITGSENADFRMKYFNADGSTGTLCGNGARCALKYVYKTGMVNKTSMKFYAGEDLYSGEIMANGLVKFNLNSPRRIKGREFINLNNKELETFFADTGSPHVVIYRDAVAEYFGTEYSLDEIPVKALGREIRSHDSFAPEGANVNFLSIREQKIYIRTYERGVENETLACGTGSVAAAVVSFLEKLIKPPVSLITRSGEQLVVDFRFESGRFSDVSLTGPAKIIFTGETEIKLML